MGAGRDPGDVVRRLLVATVFVGTVAVGYVAAQWALGRAIEAKI